jgi:DNA-binding transcriptional ArsR family regulator
MNNAPSQFLIIHDKTSNENLKLDFLRLKKAAMILRALNHKLRQQLLKLIDENQKITVTEIYVNLRLEQSVVSQHLAILRRAGIVITKREGKFIFYSLNYNRIKEINGFVEQLVS